MIPIETRQECMYNDLGKFRFAEPISVIVVIYDLPACGK
jgi:hypothetical protein